MYNIFTFPWHLQKYFSNVKIIILRIIRLCSLCMHHSPNNNLFCDSQLTCKTVDYLFIKCIVVSILCKELRSVEC